MTRLVIRNLNGGDTEQPSKEVGSKVIVNQDAMNVVVTKDHVRVISQGFQGIPGPHLISGANDIDETNRQDCSLLQFNAETGKYEATVEVRGLVINCGAF
ncbi:hypothetical protein C9I92_21830 [Photobacterium ganghwense]|uniref:Uncharacterized protein n=1 Tax=Photobacterium ganghwense TaxID=320778 RepID=A0A0J1HEY2_9GAMM|nr:hypothetical protein [Photobacterium ganghwense]KLV10179.1 hypothetical protein ABT57_06275 [Photobacterium ganghwense]PSU05429.1 hypothetical protein C9I92_21830 [Photobacterium ganghwense]